MEKSLNSAQKLKRIISLVIPASLGMLVAMMTELINLIVVGHLKNAAIVAGVGMGNMT
jgi:Na+-driven multidrug efflux pump